MEGLWEGEGFVCACGGRRHNSDCVCVAQTGAAAVVVGGGVCVVVLTG